MGQRVLGLIFLTLLIGYTTQDEHEDGNKFDLEGPNVCTKQEE